MVITDHAPQPAKTGNTVQSCDLCRLKKRKCDLKDGVPRCSSCAKSKSVCQITYVTKPRERKKKKQMETLEDRLKSLEDLIKSSVLTSKAAQRHEPSDALTPSSLPSSLSSLEPFPFSSESLLGDSRDRGLLSGRPPSASGLSLSATGGIPLPASQEQQFWTTPSSRQSELLHHGPIATDIDLQPKTRVRGDRTCSLPPAEGGFFLLQEYLVDFNVAIPIFDRVAISTVFQDGYNGRCEGRVLVWIALKLVLAIAHRLRAMSPLGVPQDTENADLYLEECLVDLHQLILERPSLLLCQLYLAMAVVISTSSRPQPAAMFVSMALRVAQDLRINDAAHNDTVMSRERLQEQRVFWIAYTMDADLSLRAGRVPTLSPELICIDLPSDDEEFAQGEIRAVGGEFKINIFRLKVELALIQAELMEQLQTPDASRHAGFDGNIFLQTLALKLEEWRKNWLFELTVEQLQSLLHRSDLVHVIVAESAYFTTLYALLAQKSPDPRLRTKPFSANALMDQICRPRCQHPHKDARRFISILRSIPGEDVATNWLTLEAMIAALAVMFAFIVNNPQEDSARSDLSLAQPLLHTLNQLSSVSKDDDLAGIQNVCVDLYLRAERALND